MPTPPPPPATQPYILTTPTRGSLLGTTILSTPSPSPSSSTSFPSTSAPPSPRALCHRFGGIPYALPLTPARRWKRALPLPSDYSYSSPAEGGGPGDFSGLSALCPQDAGKVDLEMEKEMREDCLQCNVWVPVGGEGERREKGVTGSGSRSGRGRGKGGWPVWVYIHGGFLQWGTPNTTDPTNLLGEIGAECIIVMPVYRLNLFGFLASRELKEEGETVGNLGFWDQRLALEWTYENIRDFGGDRENITLGGLSAGAHSVFHQLGYELGLPDEKAFIRRVVMYSNGAGVQPQRLQETQGHFDELIAVLGIRKRLSDKINMAKLRALPWKQLVGAITRIKRNSFRALTDGNFVRESLFQELNDGRFAKVMVRRGIQIMIGDLPDEASIYKREDPPSSYDGLVSRLSVEYPLATSKRLAKDYCPTKSIPRNSTWQDLFGRIYADVQVHMTERGLLASLTPTLPLSHIHRYRINWRAKMVDHMYPLEWGVAHASDMPIWFFGNGSSLEANEKPVIHEFLKPFLRYLKGNKMEWGTRSIKQAKAILSDGSLGMVEDKDWERCLGVWNDLNSLGSSHL